MIKVNFSLFPSRNSSCIVQYHKVNIKTTILILHILALLIANMSNYLWNNNNKRCLMYAWFTLTELLVGSVRCTFMLLTYIYALCTVCCINNEGYIVNVSMFVFIAWLNNIHVDKKIFSGGTIFESRIITNCVLSFAPQHTHTHAYNPQICFTEHTFFTW